MWRLTAVSVCAAGVLILPQPIRAVTLDWDTAAWTPGALNGGIELDNTLAGSEVTIAVTGNTNRLRPDAATGLDTPAITGSLQGGTLEQSLTFNANVGTHTEITVSVSFSALFTQGVENVSFRLFDIDKTTDSEFIKDIWAIGLDGTTHIPATITNLGSAVQHSGTGLTQLLTGNGSAVNSGAGSANGNATISFGTSVIRGFTFTFDNGPGPPRVQEFAMHDINFTPVPEINPASLAAGVCAFALCWRWRRRRAAAQSVDLRSH